VLSPKEVETILSSGSVMLFEKHTAKTRKPDGLLLTLVDGVMPDGRPCMAMMQGSKKPDLTMLENWYGYVRGEFDARKDRQEAEALSRAEARPVDSGAVSTAAERPSPSPVPDAEPVPASEATVEEILESKIASLGRLIAKREGAYREAAARLKDMEREVAAAVKERKQAIAALKAVKGA
jgi:hypothetical protein